MNIEQGDIVGIAKFTRALVGTVSVYQDDQPKLWAELQAIPPFTYDKASDQVAFEDEMKRRELCLRILRTENIFGYVGAPAMGNSDALLDALQDDAEEETEEVEA